MANKRVIRILEISGEASWVDDTLKRCWVAPGRLGFAAYGQVEELYRTVIAETPGGNEAFEAPNVGSTPASVAKQDARCQRCHGAGMIAYWDGSALAGEMCPDCDCDPPDVGPDVPGGGACP